LHDSSAAPPRIVRLPWRRGLTWRNRRSPPLRMQADRDQRTAVNARRRTLKRFGRATTAVRLVRQLGSLERAGRGFWRRGSRRGRTNRGPCPFAGATPAPRSAPVQKGWRTSAFLWRAAPIAYYNHNSRVNRVSKHAIGALFA
jgi:hypothetical protein